MLYWYSESFLQNKERHTIVITVFNEIFHPIPQCQTPCFFLLQKISNLNFDYCWCLDMFNWHKIDFWFSMGVQGHLDNIQMDKWTCVWVSYLSRFAAQRFASTRFTLTARRDSFSLVDNTQITTTNRATNTTTTTIHTAANTTTATIDTPLTQSPPLSTPPPKPPPPPQLSPLSSQSPPPPSVTWWRWWPPGWRRQRGLPGTCPPPPPGRPG